MINKTLHGIESFLPNKVLIQKLSDNSIKKRIYSQSNTKIIKRSQPQTKVKVTNKKKDTTEKNILPIESLNTYSNDILPNNCERVNEMNIQMLSKNIYNQLFGISNDKADTIKNEVLQRCKEMMLNHGIKTGDSPRLPEVKFKLPNLEGKDILEHFRNIGENLSAPYRILIENLIQNKIPSIPKKWEFKQGWHKYSDDGNAILVTYPPEDALVFDVEVCVNAGSNPVLACAVSSTAWYGWVGKVLIENSSLSIKNTRIGLDDLIPLESSLDSKGYNLSGDILNPKIVVGHNVSYDRARIKEQYWLERTGTRFLDTMSVHICVSGVTSYQRAILKSKNKPIEPEDEQWIQISSLSSLAEVHKLYCGKEISKQQRNIFLEGTLEDVKENFQSLMTYCAGDVVATHSVLKNLFPMFQQRFPHSVTLAGMLELSTAYLPVNSNWQEYINNSDVAYEDVELESKLILARKANEACKLMHDDKYKQDMWMWDQDWSIQHLKMNKSVTKKKANENSDIINEKVKKNNKQTIIQLDDKNSADTPQSDSNLNISGYFDSDGNFITKVETDSNKDIDVNDELTKKFSYLYDMKKSLPAVRPLLPGYPAWYKKLCTKPGKDNWVPGPVNISTSMQIAPKLLSLTWEGYPLHYIRGQGWGFLIPFKHERCDSDDNSSNIPFETIVQNCPVVEYEMSSANENQSRSVLNTLWKDVEHEIGKREYYAKAKKDKTDGIYKGTGIWSGIIFDDCCYFMKLPHKDGASKRVGNPLARDFLNKFSENVLSGSGHEAQKILASARMLSYWRNNRDRIKEQMVLWLEEKNLSPTILKNNNNKIFGAILPQVVVCGTLTRRATEPTWMTASNAHPERIGSELRSMVQCPPGFSFVGADVDSQELWIAGLLGDAQFGFHGATPFGWMTLSGSKAAGTDMHSHTAASTKISRDHAKVINYARIYGAGQNFAERLLKQFNPSISDGEAKSKAQKMFTTTKGKRFYKLKEKFIDLVFPEGHDSQSLSMTSFQATKIAKLFGKKMDEMFEPPKWFGGTESVMFNQLEKIAGSEEPKTPFLNCQLTRALTTNDDFRKRQLPTTVNWVVQSGAVDFLHLMLVNMAWLTCSKARFCLSFHDEVRYMVPNKYKYNAALAMHITNLFTRAFCAKKLGFDDLPQSVAFFTAVDIDTCLRKESNLDCVTPSNPHGLFKGYGVPPGESLDIWKTLEKCGGSLGDLYEPKKDGGS